MCSAARVVSTCTILQFDILPGRRVVRHPRHPYAAGLATIIDNYRFNVTRLRPLMTLTTRMFSFLVIFPFQLLICFGCSVIRIGHTVVRSS